MSWESFCHGMDRVFNHKKWSQDEKLMMQRQTIHDAHDENMYGIKSNEEINKTASQNKMYAQNGYSHNSTNSKASEVAANIK